MKSEDAWVLMHLMCPAHEKKMSFAFQEELKVTGAQVFVNPYEEVDEMVSQNWYMYYI